MARSRWSVLAGCVVVAACGSKAPPVAATEEAKPSVDEAFGDRAPAMARVLVRLDTRAASPYAELLQQLAEGAIQGRGGDPAECGAPWEKIEAVRGALGPDGMLFEVDGAIGLADVSCVLGMPVPADGRIALADFVITARPGGLGATDREGFRPGAAAALVGRFDAATGHALAVVSDLGAPGRTVKLDLLIDAERSRTLIEVGDAARADHVQQVVVRAADVMRAKGEGKVSVSRAGTAVTIDWAFNAGGPPAGLLQASVIEAFKIPSVNMWPSLELGDFVYALKGELNDPPQRGDIVVYRGEHTTRVGRIAAVGGQRIRVAQGRITVDGVAVPQDVVGRREGQDRDEMSGEWSKFPGVVATERVGDRSYLVAVMEQEDHRPAEETLVPPGHFFALGDNRGNSNDSRYEGTYPVDAIVGRVVLAWLSLGPDGVRWDRVMIGVD